jgi:hypothetical protein
MQKEGIFPEGIVKYSPDWDKAMEEYGQRIKEDTDFAERWGDAGPIYMGNNGEDGNIMIMTKESLLK